MHKNIITKLLTLKIRPFLALYLMYCRFPRLGANLVPYVFHLFSLSNADATPYIFFPTTGRGSPIAPTLRGPDPVLLDRVRRLQQGLRNHLLHPGREPFNRIQVVYQSP